MSSTNATNTEDPEKQALACRLSTASTTSLPASEDRTSKEEFDDLPRPTMSKIYHIFFCCVLVAIFTFTVVSAAANTASKPVSLEERLRFQDLLDTIEPATLHEILHEHLNGKYQHGVYQEDKAAMEVLHHTDAAVAQSLVELAKRQSNSTSSAATSSPTTSSTDSSTTSQSSTTSSASETPTQGQTSTTPTTTPGSSTELQTSTSNPTTSAASPTTTHTTLTPATTTTTTTKPSSTNAAVTTKSPTSASTSHSVTQQIVYTTTLANGGVTTVTSITVVPASQAESGGAATQTNPNASLQTNGGNSKSHFGLTGVLGAIGLAVIGAL